MNRKMITNSQLLTTEPKKNKNKLSKQVEQEQNHRNGDHMEGCQWGSGRGKRMLQNREFSRSVEGWMNRQMDGWLDDPKLTQLICEEPEFTPGLSCFKTMQ